MKRTRSALSLKNLAHSIHRSIQLQVTRNHPQQQLNYYRSQSHLLIKDHQKRQEQAKISRQQKQNRIFILQKQIVAMQKQLDNSKSSIRNYSKELTDYQNKNIKIQEMESQMLSHTEIINQIVNQISMLKEQIISAHFNTEQRIAEKEYYEQLVQAYQRQYQSQSKKVLQIIKLEQKINIQEKQLEQLNFQLCYAHENVQQWKEETGFDLNQHKIKNSLKLARVELIRLEDECDIYCNQHNLRKIRELCCYFFKNYANKNGVKMQQAKQGADIYICRNGLVQNFSGYVNQRIVYNKPVCEQIEMYLQSMAKLQTIYYGISRQGNKKLHDLQLSEIKALQKKREEIEISLNQLRQNVKLSNKQLESQFSQQSLAVIQYLRQRNRNVYDIKEIKNKLKQNKKEQIHRISQMKQAYKLVKSLQNVIANDLQSQVQSTNQKCIYSLIDQLEINKERLEQMNKNLIKLTKEKDTIQTLISNAISKWRERDQNKAKLKNLLDQLKQAKQAKNFLVTKNLPDTLSNQHKRQEKNVLNDSNRVKNFSRKESMYSLQQSKSILSLSNPYKKIMQKQVTSYKPTIQDCQMIVSKQIKMSNKQSKPFTICDLEESKILQDVSQNKSNKKTDKSNNYPLMASSKENLNMIKNKTQNLTQTKYSAYSKASIIPSMPSKAKMSESQRLSLSKLLISKFNR